MKLKIGIEVDIRDPLASRVGCNGAQLSNMMRPFARQRLRCGLALNVATQVCQLLKVLRRQVRNDDRGLARSFRAPLAISRVIASRAGITLAPSMPENALTVTACPGCRFPFIKAMRTDCVTCARNVRLDTGLSVGRALVLRGVTKVDMRRRDTIFMRCFRSAHALFLMPFKRYLNE